MLRVAVKLFAMWFGLPELLEAQPSPLQTGSEIRVFLDCRDNCFQDFMREEIEFVEYVRDPREADVHVIVTTSTTGAGGRERAISFIGCATSSTAEDAEEEEEAEAQSAEA